MRYFHEIIRVKESDEYINSFWDFSEKYNLEERLEDDFSKLNDLEDAWKYCASHEEFKEIAEQTELLIISDKEYQEFLRLKTIKGTVIGFLDYVKFSW